MGPNLTLCLPRPLGSTENTDLDCRDFVIRLSIHYPSTHPFNNPSIHPSTQPSIRLPNHLPVHPMGQRETGICKAHHTFQKQLPISYLIRPSQLTGPI